MPEVTANDVIFQTLRQGVGIAIVLLVVTVAVVWLVFPFIVWKWLRKIASLLELSNRPAKPLEADRIQPDIKTNRIRCRCNHCPSELEFEKSQIGQTVACPKCGMQTVLYSQT